MPGVNRSATDVLELSFQLADVIGDDDKFMCAAFEILARLLPSEGTGWFGLDVGRGSADLISDPPEQSTADFREAFAKTATSHPVYVDLLSRPTDHGPRRLSDITGQRRFQSTAFYNEVAARVRVNHNITFLLRPFTFGSPRVDGWSFWRRHDFSDDELELARRIQPVLAALDLVRRRPPQPLGFAETAEEGRLRTQLTVRELDVLELVAAGLTAAAVGRARRISTATVRKHLEHAYAKLGVSDRLLAVARARQLGLLPPVGESDRQPPELP